MRNAFFNTPPVRRTELHRRDDAVLPAEAYKEDDSHDDNESCQDKPYHEGMANHGMRIHGIDEVSLIHLYAHCHSLSRAQGEG